jgi:hypothetical protein
MRRTLVIALAALALLAAACEPPPPSGGTINMFTPDGKLVVRDLFVFSTAKGIDTPARSFEVKNVGSKNLVVTDITFSGPQASSFRLPSGQAKSFTLAPGASTNVSVVFRPGTLLGKHTASMFVHSSDASQPADEMFMRGYNARDYENSMEPNRSQLVDAVGYKTNVGTGLPKDAVNAGEEFRGSGYFAKATNTGPVILYPLARYSSRTIGATGTTRWYDRGSTGVGTALYGFDGCGSGCQLNPDGTMGPNEDGGENQKLVPKPNKTTVSFNPTGAFGISLFASGENLFSDDQRNDAPNTNSNTHNMRFWPMRDLDGNVVPNAWIVGIDLGLDNVNTPTKNWDYQDFMYVLSNAKPVA